MLAAIFKASYNSFNNSNVVGGICGTAFFIDKKHALTANHLLNTNNFKPNDGFSYCKFWLLIENGQSLIIEKDYLKSYPDVDTTKICFPSEVCKDSINYKTIITEKGDRFILKGFLASVPENPNLQVTLDWNEQKELVVKSFDLNSVISTLEGFVEEVKNISLNSKDVNITDKRCLILSCGGNTGLSGAPLIKSSTGEIIGLMSFGLPANITVKEKLYAISISEVEKEVK